MSALTPKADITERDRHVRFVPPADSCSAAKARPSSPSRLCARSLRARAREGPSRAERTEGASQESNGTEACVDRTRAVQIGKVM